MSDLSRTIAILAGRAIGNINSLNENQERLHRTREQEEQRRHRELLDAMEANRLGISLREYQQRLEQESIQLEREESKNVLEDLMLYAPFYRKRGFFKKNIVEWGLKGDFNYWSERAFPGVEWLNGLDSLPAVGTTIRAGEPFVHLKIGSLRLGYSIPFYGIVIENNQFVIDVKEDFTFGPWLLRIDISAIAPREMEASCPFCQGGIIFRVLEYGGKTIACPHCNHQIELPKKE
jgi:hypothetical protein